LTFRVQTPGRVAPTVTLYPDDLEWTCDCAGKVDPCAHVAAAAIAVAQGSAREGTPATRTSPPEGDIRYRLTRRIAALSLERLVANRDGSEALLAASLASQIARGGGELAVVPSHDDLLIDRLVAGRRPGFFPDDRLADVLGGLASADVLFEGSPVKTSGERV